MKSSIVSVGLLLLLATSFAITASNYENRAYCYEAMQNEASRLKSFNADQDPASSSMTVYTWGCGGDCEDRRSQCEAESYTSYQSCLTAANADGMTAAEGSACIAQSNARSLTCADYEIGCCMIGEKTKCDSLPSSAQGEIDCVAKYGGYGTLVLGAEECGCMEGAFLNTEIEQCVPLTVYGSCNERNADYDMVSDNCVCKNGYVVSGDTCVPGSGSTVPGGNDGGTTGTSGEQPISGGATGTGTTDASGSGGKGGCSSTAILVVILGLAFASRR
jgi:hypothetical protein